MAGAVQGSNDSSAGDYQAAVSGVHALPGDEEIGEGKKITAADLVMTAATEGPEAAIDEGFAACCCGMKVTRANQIVSIVVTVAAVAALAFMFFSVVKSTWIGYLLGFVVGAEAAKSAVYSGRYADLKDLAHQIKQLEKVKEALYGGVNDLHEENKEFGRQLAEHAEQLRTMGDENEKYKEANADHVGANQKQARLIEEQRKSVEALESKSKALATLITQVDSNVEASTGLAGALDKLVEKQEEITNQQAVLQKGREVLQKREEKMIQEMGALQDERKKLQARADEVVEKLDKAVLRLQRLEAGRTNIANFYNKMGEEMRMRKCYAIWVSQLTQVKGSLG